MLNKVTAQDVLQTVLYDSNNNSLINQSSYGDDINRYFTDMQASIQFSVATYANQSSSFKKSIGYDLNDMLMYCSYNWQPCTVQDFEYFFSSIYGSCYTFNRNIPAKQVSVGGPDFGLSIELFLGKKNILKTLLFLIPNL